MLENLERTVELTPKTLLNASRPESAPLHNEFEWDDGIAAEHYREDQARHIIRAVVVKQEGSDEPTRAFFCLSGGDKPRTPYLSVSRILTSETLRERLRQTALKELMSFKNKYQKLDELACVFEAIDRFAERSANDANDTNERC